MTFEQEYDLLKRCHKYVAMFAGGSGFEFINRSLKKEQTMKRITMLLVFLAGLFVLSGCHWASDEELLQVDLESIRKEPKISSFHSKDMEFVVHDLPKQIGSLPIWRVILIDKVSNKVFSALIAPDKKIEIGDKAQLQLVSYNTYPNGLTDFLMVK